MNINTHQNMNADSQNQRIAQYFRDCPNVEIPAVNLHREGSGKEMGYCGSFSRRISDLRRRGMNITVRSEWVGSVRHTFYTYHKEEA